MPDFNKKRILTLLFRLLITLLLAVGVGYFCFSCSQLKDKKIALSEFGKKAFCTKDGQTKLIFSADADNATFTAQGVKYTLKNELSGGVITASSNSASYSFIIVSAQLLYSSDGYYLYQYR